MGVGRRIVLMLGAYVLASGLPIAQVSASVAAAGGRDLAASGGWGKAAILPGASGDVGVGITTISCASPGNCVGGGPAFSNGSQKAFVANQVRGVWGKPIIIRGLATRKGFKDQGVVSAVACPSAGDCVAVGGYRNKALRREAFTVTQRRGVWSRAALVPGLASLNTGSPGAGLGALSCPSVGNCAATGSYTDKAKQSVPFVVNEVHGVWGNPIAIPGLAALPGATEPSGPFRDEIGPVSCASAGNCSAAGDYPVSGGNQGYVISEVHGTWHDAVAVPGLATLNTGLSVFIGTISCAAAGDCSAGGFYNRPDGSAEAFVVSQVHGTWDTALVVPGTAKLNKDAGAEVMGISCASPGNCGAGGVYGSEDDGDSTFSKVFVVNEVNGTWRKAIPVPGMASLNKANGAQLNTISCATAGNCSAGGFYSPSSSQGIQANQAFVVDEIHGVWGRALEVPGTGALNVNKQARVTALSCSAPGKCSASGGVLGKKGFETFVVSRS